MDDEAEELPAPGPVEISFTAARRAAIAKGSAQLRSILPSWESAPGGIDRTDASGMSYTLQACGHVASMRGWVNMCMNHAGKSLLHHAVWRGPAQTVELLLDRHAVGRDESPWTVC